MNDNKFEIWMKNDEIGRPNGLYIHDNELYMGNSEDEKINSADLEFIIEKNLLIIPTFFDNRLVAYKLIK